jgi:ABC-type microcin C transport system permease subunit YejE
MNEKIISESIEVVKNMKMNQPSRIRIIIGCIIMIMGLIVGVYIGIWECFIGGIVDVIEQLKTQNINSLSIALGIAKVTFSGLFGFIFGSSIIYAGLRLIKVKRKKNIATNEVNY